jgi:hypothetical protein
MGAESEEMETKSNRKECASVIKALRKPYSQ